MLSPVVPAAPVHPIDVLVTHCIHRRAERFDTPRRLVSSVKRFRKDGGTSLLWMRFQAVVIQQARVDGQRL